MALLLIEAFLEIFARPPTISAMAIGIVQLLGPLSIAFILGMVVGWVWKPRWAGAATFRNCKFDFSPPPSPSTSAHHHLPQQQQQGRLPPTDSSRHMVNDGPFCSSSEVEKENSELVTYKDLDHLFYLVGRKDGGPPWKHMMDRSTEDMSYQAWQRDPERGPPQYRSRTVYEDATPELLRDFFWDDEFRLKWDNMLMHASVLEECSTTGTMVVHWIRKFPFFCSDREYIIGRRIWQSGCSYYCVTKGVPNESTPRKEKPRRVDLYYSSWFIQPVESRRGNGQLSACEVVLFHHEDMGIPWEIAKFGVRQGMWGAVKNIARGFRVYQKHRATKASLSHHALMAEINTKISPDYLKILEGGGGGTDEEEGTSDEPQQQLQMVEPVGVGVGVGVGRGGEGKIIPRFWVIAGVAVAIACSLDRGFLTKSLIFGVARQFGNIGRRVRVSATPN
ncbi:uncharacterized protein LOC127244946 [Andrographis paniculata]|uniref:uncharacterized protein LOC127244946 n=1 Tax=Andrographis paniculata TaxID=175694 RepID=UPI0021E7C299|nr:uncharacterized protein LOC127244946 [Andrographis paniculata]